MKSNIDRTYITNTLSYIHLLSKNKKIEHYYEILHYFNTNSRKSLGDLWFIKLVDKAIYSFKKLQILIFFNTNSIRIPEFKSIQANIDLLHVHFTDLYNINLVRIRGFKRIQAKY